MTVSLINSGMGTAITGACEAIRSNPHSPLMTDARGWASGSRPGSVDRLQKLLGEYKGMKFTHSRFLRLQRVMICAEIIKLKRSRITVEAGLLEAAE